MSTSWIDFLCYIFSAYNQQIVEFLRQPNINEVLASKDPSYANSVALKYVTLF